MVICIVSVDTLKWEILWILFFFSVLVPFVIGHVNELANFHNFKMTTFV